MSYHGDLALGSTLVCFFNTQKTDGTPITLAGTPSLCARIDGDATEITAGLTLDVDYDGKTGLHRVTVVATGGNGYSAGTEVSIELAAGTVNGVSQVGVEVASFSIEHRSAASQASVEAVLARQSALETLTGSVVDDVGNTETTFKTDLDGSDNRFRDAGAKFIGGGLAEQVHKITASDGDGFITVQTGFTAVPSNGDAFEIVNG